MADAISLFDPAPSCSTARHDPMSGCFPATVWRSSVVVMPAVVMSIPIAVLVVMMVPVVVRPLNVDQVGIWATVLVRAESGSGEYSRCGAKGHHHCCHRSQDKRTHV
jgi:hypothetical protein